MILLLFEINSTGVRNFIKSWLAMNFDRKSEL